MGGGRGWEGVLDFPRVGDPPVSVWEGSRGILLLSDQVTYGGINKDHSYVRTPTTTNLTPDGLFSDYECKVETERSLTELCETG